MNDWMNKQRKKWIKKKEWVNNQKVNEWTNAQTNDKNNRNNHWFGGGGGGGANFPTSDDLQIFFGALYHEMVRTSPELKGSDDFLSRTPVLMSNLGASKELTDIFTGVWIGGYVEIHCVFSRTLALGNQCPLDLYRLK